MLKVLESLENVFQEVFKWGLVQSPKVLGFGQSSEVLFFRKNLQTVLFMTAFSVIIKVTDFDAEEGIP